MVIISSASLLCACEQTAYLLEDGIDDLVTFGIERIGVRVAVLEYVGRKHDR